MSVPSTLIAILNLVLTVTAAVAGMPVVLSADSQVTSISGRVVDSEGQPLAKIRVRLYEAGTSTSEDRTVVDSASTDSGGRFQLQGNRPGSHFLELEGDQGKGRVRVGETQTGETPEIVYPVRTTFIFLHDNDTHWNFNFVEEFRAAVDSYRERYENVFLLNAGDIFIRHRHRWPEDTIDYYEARSAFMIETMNLVGYDVATLGNHELHYHEDVTRRVLEQAEFPLLSANVRIETDKLPVNVRPYVILETGAGHRIGVIGLSEVPNLEGLERLDLFETARVFSGRLRGTTDLLVALTHISHRRDRELAREVSEFDLIVGGHTHTLLEKGEVVNDVFIAQAGGVPGSLPVSEDLPKYLGRVKLVMENERVVGREATVYVFHENQQE